METFAIEILSPAKPIFKGEAERVILPGEKGEFGILKGHAPFLATLAKGMIRVRAPEGEKAFEIETGFVEVNDSGVTVLAKQ
jgi:F-type H+-transporting ATPase subunit epsilon